MGKNAAENKWQAQSLSWRGQLGVSAALAPWTGRSSFKGVGLSRSKRALDLVDCCWLEACKRSKLEVRSCGRNFHGQAMEKCVHRGLVADVSQSQVRKPLSDKFGQLRTLTSGSMLYHYEYDRMLTPVEHLHLQGYVSPGIPPSLTDTDLRAMAGEAICLPCLAGIVWCLHLIKDLTSL